MYTRKNKIKWEKQTKVIRMVHTHCLCTVMLSPADVCLLKARMTNISLSFISYVLDLKTTVFSDAKSSICGPRSIILSFVASPLGK